jgi:hypothetical protein
MIQLNYLFLVFAFIALSACSTINPNYVNYAQSELSSLKNKDITLGSSFCLSIDNIGKDVISITDAKAVSQDMNNELKTYLATKEIKTTKTIIPMLCPNLTEKILADKNNLTQDKTPLTYEDFLVDITKNESIKAYERLLESLDSASKDYLKNKNTKKLTEYNPIDLNVAAGDLELLSTIFNSDTALLSHSNQFSVSTGKLLAKGVALTAAASVSVYASNFAMATNKPKPVNLFLVDFKSGTLVWTDFFPDLIKSKKDSKGFRKAINKTFEKIL